MISKTWSKPMLILPTICHFYHQESLTYNEKNNKCSFMVPELVWQLFFSVKQPPWMMKNYALTQEKNGHRQVKVLKLYSCYVY